MIQNGPLSRVRTRCLSFFFFFAYSLTWVQNANAMGIAAKPREEGLFQFQSSPVGTSCVAPARDPHVAFSIDTTNERVLVGVGTTHERTTRTTISWKKRHQHARIPPTTTTTPWPCFLVLSSPDVSPSSGRNDRSRP